MDLTALLAGLGGAATTATLLRSGCTPYALREAVASGEIVRVRQGHYALPDAGARRLEAHRVGGRLAGIWALRAHGIWTPRGPFPLEVVVPAHASRLRSPVEMRRRLAASECLVHWDGVSGGDPLEPERPARALRRLIGRVSPEILFACFESALRQKALAAAEAEELRDELVRRVGPAFAHASGVSESGAESLLKHFLLTVGVPFRQQVHLGDLGRVDFVIGERQIAEADGAAYHSSKDEFERDRLRQTMASILGYRTLRLSATLIERQPHLARAAILAALQRGDHLA